ncbi:hypothetical protein F2Q70_00009308 [Brassica cretica]|uniref:RNase H type-1 domain-containing protein n=1 Tax=Brassica cretica TaxID=69181 RepID=A0A3N6RFS9_BRACR|nr:hypothetical protein F2Q70_00009308 [Brassica cretica]KAF3546730.1 hypothetical protein DY000_02003203 [Brassica cretica]
MSIMDLKDWDGVSPITHAQSIYRETLQRALYDCIIRTALTKALDKNWNQIQLKSDTNVLIGAISRRNMIKEAFESFQGINGLANCFTSITFNYISPPSNVQADLWFKGALNAPLRL